MRIKSTHKEREDFKMGLFSGQFANVVEWEEYRDDMIFWKWCNKEIKKGSKLVIRPGQDAIFLNNGKIEGVFTDDGEYDIESEIIPFLSTLKGFKFGFNSGMRAEVLFVNTKEFQVKWGTKNAINMPAANMPGGLPIRANGTFNFKVNDYVTLIEKIAGIKQQYLIEDVKERITAMLDQLLMKWISSQGKDMFNLMANSFDIGNGIRTDLDQQANGNGLTITEFTIMSFNYPENVQNMINKNAEQSMIADMNRYQQVAMTDSLANNHGSSTASDMAGMMMGMQMANQMMQNTNQNVATNQIMQNTSQSINPNQNMTTSAKPNFCPNCGQPTGNTNFCGNCGQKLV